MLSESCRLWDLDLLTLGAAADAARRRLNPGNRVTFVIDRNINYTNICISGCRFCAFYRPPGADDGYVLDWDALAAKLVELKDHGGSGVLLQGGLNPELSLAYYLKLVSFIRGFGLAVHGFSPPEIFFLAINNGLSLEDLLRRLMDAGLSSIPGGGAEILVDRVRQPDFAAKMLGLPVAGGHGRGPPRRFKDQRHHDVRSPGDPGGTGRTPRQNSGTPGRDRRLHRLHPLDLPARGHAT